MSPITLPPRVETHSRYESNRLINEATAQAFKASVHELEETGFTNSATYMFPDLPIIFTVDTEGEYDVFYGDYPYGNSTLRASGCAVFCFHHGLHLCRSSCCTIAELVEEIIKAGYYEPGKGTWHNLFDHYGLRRASHYEDLIDSVKRDFFSTCLVDNSLYHNDPARTGRHFVNFVGISGTDAIIDDSNSGRIYTDLVTFMKSVLIAWIW